MVYYDDGILTVSVKIGNKKEKSIESAARRSLKGIPLGLPRSEILVSDSGKLEAYQVYSVEVLVRC